jgi:hypothetical protein
MLSRTVNSRDAGAPRLNEADRAIAPEAAHTPMMQQYPMNRPQTRANAGSAPFVV